jgi:hypothetical protein
MQATGDCYEAALLFLMNDLGGIFNDLDGYKLVHAEILGQGPIEGLHHGHAWVEFKGKAFDKSNGRNLVMDAKKYREMARVKEAGNNVHEYTWPEAKRKCVETGIYGPWDLKTSTGL